MDMGVTKNLAEKMTEIMRLKKKKKSVPTSHEANLIIA